MVVCVFVQDGDNGIASRLDIEADLRNLQTLVDGDIQIVEVGGVTFVMDEEGKVMNRPINWRVTQFLYTVAPEWMGHDVFVGPVVILGPTDAEGESTSVPHSALEHFDLV